MEFLFDDAVDCADGAFSGTKRAAFARVRDFVTQQIFANACGASLVDNVRHVLVAEITKRREYGVGRGLTESAKAVCLYVVAKFSISSRSCSVALPDVIFQDIPEVFCYRYGKACIFRSFRRR